MRLGAALGGLEALFESDFGRIGYRGIGNNGMIGIPGMPPQKEVLNGSVAKGQRDAAHSARPLILCHMSTLVQKSRRGPMAYRGRNVRRFWFSVSIYPKHFQSETFTRSHVREINPRQKSFAATF
jgi:hypothetical protein